MKSLYPMRYSFHVDTLVANFGRTSFPQTPGTRTFLQTLSTAAHGFRGTGAQKVNRSTKSPMVWKQLVQIPVFASNNQKKQSQPDRIPGLCDEKTRGTTMLLNRLLAIGLVSLMPVTAFAQVGATEINGFRFSVADGISPNTNVSFSVGMRLIGEETFRDTASLGQDVSITATIHPESGDIGKLVDVVIVDYQPGKSATMRNADGIFVGWNGGMRTLVPYLEDVTLEEGLEAEVFSGQLGAAGDHRIFVGYFVDDALYFTPTPMRINITEEPAGPTARDQAITLFESTISPTIVHARCIQCHVSGGQADGQSIHQFVRTTNANHLSINFQEFEELHGALSTLAILRKVQGLDSHGGFLIFSPSSQQYQDLQDFLELLDQAAVE